MRELSAAIALLVLLVLAACGPTGDEVEDDDVDAGPTNLGDMLPECAEGEELLFPACVSSVEPERTVYGCYIRCQTSADCPQALVCIEVVHNPCADGNCANCTEAVGICEPKS